MYKMIDEIYDLIEDRNHQFSLIEEWDYTPEENQFSENQILQKGILYLLEDTITSKMIELKEINSESKLIQRYFCPHTQLKRFIFKEEYNLLFFQSY
mgnify:CR=1 FL=1